MNAQDEPATAVATLVVEMPDGLRHVPLADGVTIGRDARSDVLIDHPTVSRHHARIGRVGDTWQFQDLGSRNGTRGGVTPGHPFDLIDGAPLRIGRVRAWFFNHGVPDGWTPADAVPVGGKLVRCRCGHVGWAPAFVTGLSVRCRRCKRRITVEDDVAPAAIVAVCAGCRDAVAPGQASHVCPSCGATMHASCYEELRGCATYGCDRVNEHATPHDVHAPDAAETPEAATVDDRPPHHDRWTIALLALVGLPLFGVPAIGWSLFAAGRRRPARVIALAVAAGVVGVAASALVWPRLLSAGGAPW